MVFDPRMVVVAVGMIQWMKPVMMVVDQIVIPPRGWIRIMMVIHVRIPMMIHGRINHCKITTTNRRGFFHDPIRDKFYPIT
jgi:hypothetical protein